VEPPFALVLNQTARVDVQLKVGKISETVEVTGAAPLLQTETTDVSTHIDSVVSENVPLITRNYGQLTLLTPGAVSTNPGAFTSGQNTFQVGRPYINGNREQTSNYILDGIDNNQNDNNEVAYSPSPDAIQEFNLITQNPSAEFGNFLGGIMNTTIKSGTKSASISINPCGPPYYGSRRSGKLGVAESLHIKWCMRNRRLRGNWAAQRAIRGTIIEPS
jgi:hypothetical protein